MTSEKIMSEVIVGPGTVVSFHYDLYDAEANKIESSSATTGADAKAMLFLFGESSVLAGLQDAFRGKKAGEDFSVTIPHEKAYGRHYPDRIQRIPRKKIDGSKRQTFRPGQIVTVRGEHGPVPGTIVKVGKFHVDIDGNHPLAGQDLTFDVRVESVREASNEEVAHGHAHGPGGHAHH
jgi:FKBP-type peptidyl-prolyl cis-trans isomerase SlyD